MNTVNQPIIQGKQMDVGDALRTYVLEKFEDIKGKYFNRITDAQATFAREGHGRGAIKARISFRVGKDILVVSDASAEDAYVAFDAAAEKTAKQLRRFKRRLRDHHDRQEVSDLAGDGFLTAKDYTLAAATEESEESARQGDDPLIIAEITTRIETMSVPDAVMRMELSSLPVFTFRNAKHQEVNIIYRRNDGNIGWIDPVGNAVIASASVRQDAARTSRKSAAART